MDGEVNNRTARITQDVKRDNETRQTQETDNRRRDNETRQETDEIDDPAHLKELGD